MHLNRNNGFSDEVRTGFFRSIRREEELDENTFSQWKAELQNNLPAFWEEMSETFKRR